MTLLPLLLAIQNRSPFVTAPNVQEPLFALAFLKEAYTGLTGALDESFDLRGETKIEMAQTFNGPTRRYIFFGDWVEVDVATGRIVAYLGGGHGQSAYDRDGRFIPRTVSDRSAKAIAQRLYNAAGFPGEIDCEVKDPAGPTDADVEVVYGPAVHGIPYWGEGGGSMNLDRQTGLLHSFIGSNSRADPPALLTPAISLDAARAIALRAGVDRQGEALSERAGDALRLAVWVPSRDDAPKVRAAKRAQGVALHDYEEAPAADAARRAHRGILAYWGSLDVGSPSGPLRVVIDAGTGAVLSFSHPLSTGVGGNGGRGPASPASPPLLPATATRPWRVAVGSGPLVGPATATLTPMEGAVPTAGIKVDLIDGRAAFPTRYDPATGLLAIGGRAYRPGPALADLLRRKAGG